MMKSIRIWSALAVVCAAAFLAGCNGNPTPPQTGAIQGTVVDTTGHGVAGASITTSPDAGSAVSGFDGGYQLNGVPVGTCTVSASKSGYRIEAAQASVTAGQTTTVQNKAHLLSIPAGTGTIQGTVRDDANVPVSGVTVTTNPASFVATSGADGSYQILNVPAGSYGVVASKPGYTFDTGAATVTAGQAASADLRAHVVVTYGSISGTVLDAGTSLPVAGASITTDPAGGTAVSASDGSYTISNLRAGTYRVIGQAPYYSIDTVLVAVQGGQNSTVHHVARHLEREPNDTFLQANTMSIPDAVDGWIGATGDIQDWFRFTAPANGLVTVRVQNLMRSGTAAANVGKVSILMSDQKELANNGGYTGAGNVESLAQVPVTAGQTYYVLVSQYSTQTARYRVSLLFDAETHADQGEPNDSKAQATPIGENSSTTAMIGYGSDAEDWYVLVPAASGTLTVTTYNLQPGGVAHGNCGLVEILDASNTQKSNNGGYTGPGNHESLKSVPVVAGQHYYIHVSRYGNLDATPYRLEVARD